MPPSLRTSGANKPVRRLRRELNGEKYLYKPPAHELPRATVDSLEPTLALRSYMILGEQSTYPHHLITLRRPPPLFDPFDPYALHYGPSSQEEVDLPPATITYWSLSSPSRLTIASTTQHIAPSRSYDLQCAFTAWQNSSSQLLQVLGWARFRPSDPTSHQDLFTSLEFRRGSQSIQLKALIPADPDIQVCFGNVTPTNSSVIRVLHGTILYLHEPSGGTFPALSNTAAWTTLRPNRDYTVASTVPSSPRLRTCNLTALTTQFLRTKFPSLATEDPVFQSPICTLLPAKRVLRTKPGVHSVHPRTLIAFCAYEVITGLTHVFVFSLQLPEPEKHPRVQIVVAKAFGGLEAGEYHTALRLSGVHASHRCERDCVNDEVGVLKEFRMGKPGVGEIRCEGMGIVLEGWEGEEEERGRECNERRFVISPVARGYRG